MNLAISQRYDGDQRDDRNYDHDGDDASRLRLLPFDHTLGTTTRGREAPEMNPHVSYAFGKTRGRRTKRRNARCRLSLEPLEAASGMPTGAAFLSGVPTVSSVDSVELACDKCASRELSYAFCGHSADTKRRPRRTMRKTVDFGERAGTRTQDLLIKSQSLYRLSYALAPRPKAHQSSSGGTASLARMRPAKSGPALPGLCRGASGPGQ